MNVGDGTHAQMKGFEAWKVQFTYDLTRECLRKSISLHGNEWIWYIQVEYVSNSCSILISKHKYHKYILNLQGHDSNTNKHFNSSFIEDIE